MADIHGDPRTDPNAPWIPAAPNAGPAPVPYGGADQQPEPPDYAVDLGPAVDHPGDIVHAVAPGNAVQETGAATDMSALAVSGDAPYFPGPLGPINAAGDPDAGGRDDVAGDVAGAVAAAHGRWTEFMGDNGTTGIPGPGAQPVHAGSIGDLMQFPPAPLDPGAGVGNTLPAAAFYDPPREYGGTQAVGGPQGAPGYGGEQGLPPPGQQGEAQ